MEEVTAEQLATERLRSTIRRCTAAVLVTVALGGGIAYKVTRPERWGYAKCLEVASKLDHGIPTQPRAVFAEQCL